MSKKRSRGYDPSAPLLAVYMHERRVGTLGRADSDVWFKYDEWTAEMDDASHYQLSVKLPITQETYGHEETLVFFDNLLLESDTRRELAAATKYDPTDTPGLLGKVGSECAGAVSVWPIDVTPPAQAEYRPISAREIETIFRDVHGTRLSELQLESRQSMSGVQQKLVFAEFDQAYQLPLNGAPSSVILKRTSGRYEQLAANEHACMRLVATLDLPVAETRVLNGADGVFVATRFDRVMRADGHIARLHQEDFCQAAGRRLTAKYQKDGGAGFSDVARILRAHATVPAHDITYLVRSAVANVCVGNMDAHAKNFALLSTPDHVGLAPLYDIVCTETYASLDHEMSMNFGHTRNPAAITGGDITRLARDLSVSPSLVVEEIERVTDVLLNIRHDVFHDVVTEVGPATILDRIDRVVVERCHRLREATVQS